MLQIYNNLTRCKEVFQPIDPGHVRMYVCGMTVYDYCHIGHARVLVIFDVVYRQLCRIFGQGNVDYVRNVTDIDDKIIQRARQNDEVFSELTGRFIEAMHEDADALGVLRPNSEPLATGHMQQIIEMIQTLIDKGFAYAASNGDVYYAVSRFKEYGRLSGKRLEDLRAGERVEVDASKRDPLDFVLWKAAKPAEPSWHSPWGQGRPGWHIECSAMSTYCLGHHFDIHGGGLDLQFPHHENEIAQSEAATGEKFVNVWMHNGFVRVDDEKMSKSLGNFFTIREVLKTYDAEVIRYFILTSHYRSPLNYSDQHLNNARAALTSFYTALRGIDTGGVEALKDDYTQRVVAALDDDFNTPEALSVLFELAHEVNRLRDSDMEMARRRAAQLKLLGDELGLLQGDPQAFLQAGITGDGPTDEEIGALIQARLRARQDKQWSESDRIRDDLKQRGIVLEDGPQGTTWRHT